MAKQAIDTEQVATAVTKLQTANENINAAFSTFQKSANGLEDNWTGPAGSAAQTVLYQIYKGNEARSNVLQNYINLLLQVVSQGYIIGEETNVKLADQFK